MDIEGESTLYHAIDEGDFTKLPSACSKTLIPENRLSGYVTKNMSDNLGNGMRGTVKS